jgi:predicted Ser/Thr protein kinase
VPPGASHPRRVVADRYELHELLGAGGMGRVFRAHDTRLKRWIAIKLLIGTGSEASRRLLQEAQAQARVEHEHVCRVYEVGWDEEGEPFIVMQLIEGEALSDAAPKLSFEQRARLVQQVAEAVHAANRLGVIHRDLKPGNVLVERTPEGTFRSYVTDFGLARDATEVVSHGIGSVVGTPNYMAPEQARGETSRIDRRTDVYGLGATLYEVLSGKLPFDGNAYDVLNQVTKNDPKPLAKIDPQIPQDLAAISRKCMEKDQNQRYDSARALAEDLQRWLDGETILAQPPSFAYQTKRLIQRHRALSIGIAAVLIVASIAAIWSTRARGRARVLAETFGQDVSEIENRMRFAQVLPLHDISEEEADVRERMARIQREMKPLGKEGIGPGQYALGRGSLALGESEKAKMHFKLAWDAGYQTPETAIGLGLSLVALYRQGLEEANRLTDKKLREHRRATLAQLYRAPAKAALQEGAGATTEPAEYVDALIRFCDEDFDGAEKVAADAFQQVPWLYQARILLGQIHRERGLRSRANGDDAGAIFEFAKAEGPLKFATLFGRSDPYAWGELCALETDELDLRSTRGRSLDDPPEDLFESCANAVATAPNRAPGSTAVAEAKRTWAEMQLREGADPSEAIAAALTASRKALAIAPGDSDASVEYGLDLRLAAQARSQRGDEIGLILEQAVEALQRALSARPESVQITVSLARVLTDFAAQLFEHKLDSSAQLKRAIELLQHAQELDPESVEPQAALGRALLLQARIAGSRGEDPGPILDRAIADLQTAAAANQAPLEYVGLAAAYTQRAEAAEAAGQDPGPNVQAALAALQKPAALGRRWPDALLVEARAQSVMARQSLKDGTGDAAGFLQLARSSLNDALRTGRKDAEALRVSAAVDELEKQDAADGETAKGARRK